jgi:hypothetical protein
MPIQTDIIIDYANQRFYYNGGFTDGIADSRYTVNELYSYLQDVFDEPEQMDDPIPMSAQTPTQYTVLYPWFIDNTSTKALYSGSIQTSGWTKSGSDGITIIHWATAGDAPTDGDIGVALTQATSGATGVLLKVDTTRLLAWVRNTSTTQFDSENSYAITGTGVDFTPEAGETPASVQSGETVWTNVYSVGTIQDDTEIYVAQDDDYIGGVTPTLKKLTSWWDSDTDFTASTLGVAAGHFDVLVAVQEGGLWIDDLNASNSGRLAVFARQGGTVYSHFEFLGAVGNFVVPFASTGYDINVDGFHQMATDADHSPTDGWIIGEVITGSTQGKAILTAYVDDVSIDYILLGKDLDDFGDTDTITGETSGTTCTRTTGAATDINGAAVSGVTVTFGENAVDVDEDGTDEHYAMTIDCNNNNVADVYQYLMYITRRGSTTNILPDPSGTSAAEDGEFYRGVGDQYIVTDAKSAGSLTEGETVSGSLSSATGELVAAYWGGSDGYLIVTNVKGSFVNNDVITGGTSSETQTASANGENLVDNNAAPFGSFAGGRFFVARGVVLTNVPSSDNNNWQTSDVTGTAYQPPTTILITFAGLSSNDRAFIAEVGTAGGIDIVKTTVGVTSGAVGASLVVLDASVAQDVPSAGWIRVVDTSDAANGTEWRFEYSSYSAANVTLRTITQPGATADAGGSQTQIVDVGIAPVANFGTDGYPKIGMIIRNTTDTEYSVVVRRIDDDTIEVTDNGTTWASKNYDFNKIPILMATDDTCYFPYVDEVATGAQIQKSIKYDGDTEIVVRARFSDPDIGGDRILPFEQTGQTIENSNLTVTAIRTDDTIATP